MISTARPSTVSRIGGVLLIIAGAIMLFVAPAGFYYLSALGCGMNTTGCRGFDFPWAGMALYVLPVMIVAAAMIWGGRRMVRHPCSGLFAMGLIIALAGVVAGYLWMSEWYGSELFTPAAAWEGLLTMTGPPLVIGAALMHFGRKARQRWLATSAQS